MDPDALDNGLNEVLADDNIFELDEDDGERNAFDFIHNLLC